ncbi:NADH-quinone oxidoreductase subunit D [candidate division LCP-89 bacterium B3_LCP]|uniref:NADH-quinone oxidoreductase subunit D n=1 Tax=candidate division LCP-89 bacterium B3_LCP TaxID=2012998 RepID=A0A532V5W6_UNCL8|nr:MAG: NADH-quinone oxidoreductase subunit D [candidate division LCP-89 bacterium B3_LCP]
MEEEIPVEEMFLNMGPSHPSMHGIVRIMVRITGERIVWSDVEIGYLHRAFEKSVEANSWNSATIYTDRLNYVSPIINNVGYCMAVEKLLGITIPERGEYVRVLLSEISRIADHITAVGAAAMELGAFTAFLYTMKAREYCYELIESACGARITTNFARVGGICADLPEGFESECRKYMPMVADVIVELDKLLTRNRIFIDRTKNIGAVSGEDAVKLGFTGPLLRASGVAYDVRRAFPYSIYETFDFAVPVGTNGDVFDRYLVRMEEMRQSMKIVYQCLDKLPDGPVNAIDKTVTKPDKTDVYDNIEGLMNQFKLVMDGHGINPPPGEFYQPVEAGNGELGFYVVSDGTDKPYKCRCRPPCFPLVQAIPFMLKDHMVADVVPIFGSINMIGGELDR